MVDDKPLLREMVHNALVGHARAVRQATSIEKAVELLAQSGGAPDFIIADWDMLPLGGLELLRMIRCRTLENVDPRTSFVIFTGRAEEAAVRCALELDVNGFAVAPLTLNKLARTIAAALRRTWLLQNVAHYASVPCVVPPPAVTAPIIAHGASNALAAARSSPLGHVQPRRKASGARICGLNEIKPGTVLARDIRDIHGTLLLRTGTALEPGTIHRLRRAAGAGADRYQLWVRR